MIYLGLFSNKNDIMREFQISRDKDSYPDEEDIDVYSSRFDEFNQYEILLAWYQYEDYSGSAFVLLHKDSKFYEVTGSHCSCMGLEDQFSPEPVSLEYLREKAKNGFYYDECDDVKSIKSFLLEIISVAEKLGEEEFLKDISKNMYKHSPLYKKYCIDNMGKELLD